MIRDPVGDNPHVILRVEEDDDVRSHVDPPLRRRLRRRAGRMVRAVGLYDVELSVLLAGDETVSRLNRDYRRRRGTTDVLSFGLAEPEELARWRSPARRRERVLERVLGDVVISVEVVARRSPAPPAFESDLVDLLAHGLLHLVGHHHPDARGRDRMLALQSELVQAATSRGPVPFVDVL
jgi:rRNA maturation RNase YbeY